MKDTFVDIPDYEGFYQINLNGVSWHNKLNKWISRIEINNKVIHLGVYDNEKDASKMYKTALANMDMYLGSPSNFRYNLNNVFCLQS